MAKTGALIAGGTGIVLVWSAIQNASVLTTLGSLIRGKAPKAGPAELAAPAASGGVTPTGVSGGGGGGQSQATRNANQALGRVMAAAYGWATGTEWTALNNIVEAESGWDADIVNASGSTASGIAQNISGFGPGYQKGNAAQQIAWLLSYIKGRYGDPVAAWSFHLANGYY
jgi:hypothetical protein